MSTAWSIPILTYHRVGEPKDDHVPTVSADAFEQQLRAIRWFGFEAIRFEALMDRLQSGAPLPRKTVCITFDDGYEETCTVASPLLRKHGLCATVFVTPMEIGQPGFLNWTQLRDMAQDGFSVGSHTLHHTYLPLASEEQVRRELVESKRMLDEQLGTRIGTLSYPIGGFTTAIQRIAKEAGYRAACTTNRGYTKSLNDAYAVRRIKITERDRNPLLLRAKLSGYYDCFRRLERPG